MTLLGAGGNAAAIGPVFGTDHNANISITGGVTVQATGGSGDRAARGIVSYSTGKKCFSFTTNVSSPPSGIIDVGIGKSSASLSSLIGGDSSAYGAASNGIIYNGGGGTGQTVDTYPQSGGEVDLCAVDFGNSKVWWWTAHSAEWNQSGTANPATNTGGQAISAGTYFIMVSVRDTTTTITINPNPTGHSAFPAGFSGFY